jgi:Holliday junction resolvase
MCSELVPSRFILSKLVIFYTPNKNYQKGRAFEYRVKKHYEKCGYDVHRKYASKGVMDLVCIAPVRCASCGVEGKTIVAFVQCKAGKARMSLDERDALIKHANKFNGLAVEARKDEKGHIIREILNAERYSNEDIWAYELLGLRDGVERQNRNSRKAPEKHHAICEAG